MIDRPAKPIASTGEHDLNTLMAQMKPKLDPRTFVFATLENDQSLAHAGKALMMFRESEGVTLILEEKDALSAGLDSVFPSRRITLEIHSALDAVGFLAAIVPVLAEQGMGVNPVSGYFHDHLFVPEDRAEQAMGILRNLSLDAKNS